MSCSLSHSFILMEHFQPATNSCFLKSNEDVFLDSLLDILDECHDWDPSVFKSSKIKATEQKENHELLINEMLSLSQSSNSLLLSNAFEGRSYNELSGGATLSEPSNRVIIGGQPTPRLCRICGEKAGKHVYYGGQCCTSCRAFFRRSVQNNSYRQFTCSSETKDCIINLQTRKGCQLCRFQKCISAGMRESWVLPDGERRSKKSRMVLNIPSPLPSFNDPGGLTSKEVSFVFSIKKKLHKSFFDNVNSMVNRDSDFLIDFVDYLGYPTRSEHPYLRMAMSLEKIQLLSFISMGASSSLHFSQEDLFILYQMNYPKINIFREASSISTQNCPDMDELIHSIHLLHLKNNEILQNLPSKVKFTLQHYLLNNHLRPHENESHSRFLHLISQINSWVMEDKDNPKQDHFSYVIMIFILFFDRIDSEKLRGVKFRDPDMIERAQLIYVQMLNRYFQRRYPRKSSKKFLEAIMLPSLIVEALQLSVKLKLCTCSYYKEKHHFDDNNK